MIMIHIVKFELINISKGLYFNTCAYRRAAWWQWLSLWSPTEPISRQGPWYLCECGSRLHSWSWWHRSKPRTCWWLGYLWADEEHGIITLNIYIWIKKGGANSHLSLVDCVSMQDKNYNAFILRGEYNVCWCSGDARSQGIGSHVFYT